jgi:hypothetical protein
MDVLTAVINRRGENTMTTLTNEEPTAQSTAAAVEKPEPPKRTAGAARSRHVAPSKGKSGKKATSAKKGSKGGKRVKVPDRAAGARQGSKTETVLDLLKRPGGTTATELMKATGWQPHSVRGFLSGTIGKKMGLAVTSTKGEDGERTYSVKG